MRYRLTPHPFAAATPFTAVDADMRRAGGGLLFTFRVIGAAALKRAPPSAPSRRDGLWRTTCFEAFIRPGAGADYLEFNFSPSGDWAANRFTGYRRGMTNAGIAAPEIFWSASGRAATLRARIDADALGLTPSVRLGICAVLETVAGEKSYWALKHSGDKPDFHHPGGFIARLSVENRS